MSFNAADFTHDHTAVYYLGEPIASFAKREHWKKRMWHQVPSGVDAIDKAVNNAIWAAPNDVTPSDLRRKITDILEQP